MLEIRNKELKKLSHIKLIFSDVDHTLITDDLQVLPNVVKAVKTFVNKRGYFVLASARPPLGLINISNKIQVSSLLVCLGGALIIKANKNNDNFKTIFNDPLSHLVLSAILKIINLFKFNMSINVYSDDDWFITQENSWIKKEEKAVNILPTRIKNFKVLIKQNIPIYKILCMGPSTEIIRLKTKLKNKPFLNVNCSTSNPNYLEIVNKSVSKSNALKIISKKLSIPINQTLAIGDSENDLPMIENAGVGVAMRNAPLNVKKKAKWVVKDNNEGGIAQTINFLFHSSP